MCSHRGLFAALLCILISFPTAFGVPAPEPVLVVLTRASGAHLNAMPAFAGLSVFEGESVSTEAEGNLGVRIGGVMLALSGSSSATLHRISGGTHVDMESGWLYFSSPANTSVEVHAIAALLRPAENQLTQAQVRIAYLSRRVSNHPSRQNLIKSTWTRKVTRRSPREQRGRIHRPCHEVRS